MSRIGKQKIILPSGVKIEVRDGVITVKGAKESLTRNIPSLIEVVVSEKELEIKRTKETRAARELHGLMRTLISNMVKGVSGGFEKKLQINGLGYRAQVQGQTLKLSLGFSHPLDIMLPKNVQVKIDGSNITLMGPDKELLGSLAADLRSIRPPEPYKGTGVKYEHEIIQRKVGKTGATASS
ncbi:MAG: 50S ribosomal protein L6 [Deltaproteobacteria bacterium]|nr:50S ribosomal protein L6 [Deltaproteobacteria bacterium]